MPAQWGQPAPQAGRENIRVPEETRFSHMRRRSFPEKRVAYSICIGTERDLAGRRDAGEPEV
jgi:hypothetical protein